jgi:hypothetical protein
MPNSRKNLDRVNQISLFQCWSFWENQVLNGAEFEVAHFLPLMQEMKWTSR